jgi:hypothetical protein
MIRPVTRYPLPAVTPGTRRQVAVFAHGGPGARPRVYLQAGLHGNEHPGPLVLHHLLQRLDALSAAGRIKGSILTVPLVNPIGLAQFINQELVGRCDLFGGNNFNRGFPRLVEAVARRVKDALGPDGAANQALVRTALAEEAGALKADDETEALRQLIARLAAPADLALDLHADGQSLLHLYTHPIHRTLGVELGAWLGAPVVLLGADPSAQSFDDALNLFWTDLAGLFPDHPLPHGCFAATVEMRGRADVDDATAEADADRLVRFLMAFGAIEGEPGPRPEPVGPEPTPLEGVFHGRAPKAGLAVYKKKLGERVAAGEVVAEIVDPAADDPALTRSPITSGTDGLFFSQNLVRLVRPGQIFFKVAGKATVKGPQDSLLED